MSQQHERSAGRIAVIGSIMTDLVTSITRMPERGETLEAARFALGHGGKGANQAVAAANLGSDVLFVGKVGDDAFGAATLENFRAHAIGVQHVGVVAGVASGVAPIFVEPSGDNRILIVKGANDCVLPADLDRARTAIARCAMIVLQLEIPLETVYYAIDLGAEFGVPVLLNPAPARADLDLDRLRGVAFFMPNQSELALLTGLPSASIADAALAARVLVAAGIGTVIVTLGADGALFVDAAHEVHLAAPQVDAVDTTGAGDAFIGCFAHHVVAGASISGAIATSVRYAADSVTRSGSQMSFATRAAFAGLSAT
jgi:ribokinase